MISLKEFNDKGRKRYSVNVCKDLPKLNGIECPSCNSELFDVSSDRLLLSMPPQVVVLCKKCNFKGFRIA